jgi:hypothetical protein
MPDDRLSWQQHAAARAVVAGRYTRSAAPRVKVHLSDTVRPSLDQILDLEFAFTTWDQSCKDPLLTDLADFRQCRRAIDHDGDHACGFGSARVRWP